MCAAFRLYNKDKIVHLPLMVYTLPRWKCGGTQKVNIQFWSIYCESVPVWIWLNSGNHSAHHSMVSSVKQDGNVVSQFGDRSVFTWEILTIVLTYILILLVCPKWSVPKHPHHGIQRVCILLHGFILLCVKHRFRRGATWAPDVRSTEIIHSATTSINTVLRFGI